MPLKTNGLEMPPDFPSAAYEAVVDIVMANRAGHWSLVDFVGAWHAVSYRFLATADYGNEFVASLAAHGLGPAADERHEQEKMLFGLFGSGHSSFEAAY